MSETTTVASPRRRAGPETKPGLRRPERAAQEDKRLVQGEAQSSLRDVKRHNMGYVHFVRSPYAHAKLRLGRPYSKALEKPRVPARDRGKIWFALLTDRSFRSHIRPGGH